MPVISVLLISQPFGLAAAVVWALNAGGRPPAAIDLAVAAAGGVAGALALGALYAAMSRGMIGLASPISATGVLVPFVYGLARGESLSLLALIGAVLAIAGILFAVHQAGSARPARADLLGLLFAAGAALGFGVMFVGVAVAAKHSPAWAVLAVRTGGCVIITAGALLARRPFAVAHFDLPRLAAIGVLDVFGSALYALGTRHGHVSLVAVAASTYPVVTVLLAARVLGERLGRSQRVGVTVAIVGIAAIAAGS